jgi:hypothetical protein
MTITEFLEARITEDEAAANDLMGEREGDRVLAECAAKRAIIAEHGEQEVASLDRATWGQPFIVCRVCAIGARQVVAPCPTLRALAAVYADHPDYDPAWA